MFMIKYSKSDLWPSIGRKKKQQISNDFGPELLVAVMVVVAMFV